MKYLFLLLVLTACTAPNTSAGTAATNAAQTDLRPLPEKDYKLFINNGNPYLKEYGAFFAQQFKRYGKNAKGEALVNFTELQAFASSNSFLGIYSFMEETFKPNITNIALAKYEAREDLSLEELQALRKPVPDWETYKRLVRAEDGFDNTETVYWETNNGSPSLGWLGIVYYEPQQENYYHGVFKPTNINGWQDLVNTKKDPAQEVYGRDRVVLITNISPSLHIYADALNNYKLYVLNLKSILDDYGYIESEESDVMTFRPIWPDNSDKTLRLTWRANTNRSLHDSITYYALTNNVPLISSPWITPYLDYETVLEELAKNDRSPLEVYYGAIIYSDKTKYLYNGIKYNFVGDIAELTNEIPPMKTNYMPTNHEAGFRGYANHTAFYRGFYGALGMR